MLRDQFNQTHLVFHSIFSTLLACFQLDQTNFIFVIHYLSHTLDGTPCRVHGPWKEFSLRLQV